MGYNYRIISMRDEAPRFIVEYFKTLLRTIGSSPQKVDYYCGIATIPDDRFIDHEHDHWKIKKIIGVIDCGNRDKCCEVEKLMYDEGFDVGRAPGRGPGEDTQFVYLVEKGSLKEDLLDSTKLKSLKEFLNDINRNSK